MDQFDASTLNTIAQECFENAKDHGFHDTDRGFPCEIALIHSEASEALEAWRKDHGEDKIAEELADIIIRVFDSAHSRGHNIGLAVMAKMEKNRGRPYMHGGVKV